MRRLYRNRGLAAIFIGKIGYFRFSAWLTLMPWSSSDSSCCPLPATKNLPGGEQWLTLVGPCVDCYGTVLCTWRIAILQVPLDRGNAVQPTSFEHFYNVATGKNYYWVSVLSDLSVGLGVEV